MKSIRLTNSSRDDIINSITKAWKVSNPKPEVKYHENEAGLSYHRLVYKDYLHLFTAKLSTFFKTKQSIMVQVKGIMERFDLMEDIPLEDTSWGTCSGIVSEITPEHKKYLKVKDEYDIWHTALGELISEAKAVIYSCNTTKQLLEVWAEVEDYLPAYLSDPSKAVQLPALQISRLNERLTKQGEK